MSLPHSPQDISPLDKQNVVALEEAPPSAARLVLIETIQTIVLALVLFFAINVVSARVRVEYSSMEPNFHDGDYIIVNRLAYKWGQPERGDVVVFPYPNNPEEDYIKRVIGLPGDRVAVYSGVLYINGLPIDEPYLAEPMREDYPEHIVPEGSVIVMGDNRNASSDSRGWGPLPISDIIGKAIFRYYPFDTVGVVDHPDLLVSPTN